MLLVILFPAITFAQFSISGKVSDAASGEVLTGAVIQVNGTYLSAITDVNGGFKLSGFKQEKYIFTTSLLGYKPQVDTIQVNENQSLEIKLQTAAVMMDEVQVNALRANQYSGMAYSSVSKTDIEKQNLGQDLPYLLNTLPSVVTTSDAGAGIGYTSMRIRGSDGTRINATINGIPVNDAESHGTYWVDIPDIASSIDNIQVQRGVGTSTNGAGAFGGSINIQTTTLNPKPYATFSSSAGSFNTFKNTVNVGTGLMNEHWAFDARLSKINSDGYIDRAFSDLKSYYLSGAYYSEKTIIKAIVFSGSERTYQAWNGVPEQKLNNDLSGLIDYATQNYLSSKDSAHLLSPSSTRTFNPFTYSNQTDNYQQDYYQLHISQKITNSLSANVALHFTKGKGYYEEYKQSAKLADYGIAPAIIGVDTTWSSDLIRRKWLNNNFYGTVFSLTYNANKKYNATVGGGWNKYDGQHYGEVVWARYASNSEIDQRYYSDTAHKTDFNIYVKANYSITSQLHLFADMQYRTVYYSFLGLTQALTNAQQSATLNFINPKAGVTFDLNSKTLIYASFAVGNKEPNRDDYVQSTPDKRPSPESLTDFEGGIEINDQKYAIAINGYYMDYKNQLALTGKLNDVGAPIRINIPQSYRAGVEVEAAVRLIKKLTISANVTLSQNKIKSYQEHLTNYNYYPSPDTAITYSNTDLAYSPSTIAAATLSYELLPGLKADFVFKYVGKQYLDNTSNESRTIRAYNTCDARISYQLKGESFKNISVKLAINNLFNTLYVSNGYTYGFMSGYDNAGKDKIWYFNHYYPQAGVNFLGGITLSF